MSRPHTRAVPCRGIGCPLTLDCDRYRPLEDSGVRLDYCGHGSARPLFTARSTAQRRLHDHDSTALAASEPKP